MAGKSIDLSLNIRTQFSNIKDAIQNFKNELQNINFNTIFARNNFIGDNFTKQMELVKDQFEQVKNFQFDGTQSNLDNYNNQVRELQESYKVLNSIVADYSQTLQANNNDANRQIQTFTQSAQAISQQSSNLQNYIRQLQQGQQLLQYQQHGYQPSQNEQALITLYQNETRSINDLSQEVVNLNNLYDVYLRYISDLQQSQESYNRTSDTQRESARTLRDSISSLVQERKNEVDQIKEQIDCQNQAQKAADRLAEETRRLAVEEAKAAEISETFGKSFSDAVKNSDSLTSSIEQQIIKWTSFRSIISLARRAITDIIQTYQELDDNLSAISAVSGISTQQLWGDMPSMIDNANKLALSINDLTDGMLTLYQQGLNTVEVETRLDAAGKLAAISQQGLGTAVDQLTAVMNTFNLSTEDSTKVVDILANESANSAISVAELGAALQPVASLAASAGMSLETTAAFITTMESTTRQSASVIGNALKTIIARFQQLKTSSDALEDGTSANKVEEALASAGVALRDATGSFRDFDEVIMELSSKWDTLDSNTQRYIATVGAGTRQQSQFIALVSNYAKNIENISTATNSAGAAEQQFQAVSTNLSASLKKLNNNFDALKTSFFDGTGVISGIVNVFADLVGLFAKLPSAFSIGAIALVSFTGKMLVLNKTTALATIGNELYTAVSAKLVNAEQRNIASEVILNATRKKLSSQTVELELKTRGLNDAISKSIAADYGKAMSTGTLSTSFSILKGQIIGVVNSFISLQAAGGPLLWVIEGLVLALGAAMAYSFYKTQKAADDAKEAIQNFNDEASKLADSAEKIESEADALRDYSEQLQQAKLDGQDLSDIKKQLISEFGDSINGLDIETASYKELSKAIQDVIQQKELEASISRAGSKSQEQQANKTRADYLQNQIDSGNYEAPESSITYRDKSGNIFTEEDIHLKAEEIGVDPDIIKSSYEVIYEEKDIYVEDQDGKKYHFDSKDEALDYIEKLKTDAYSKSESTDAYNKMVQIDSSFVEGLDIAKDDLIGILKNYTSEVSGVIFGKDENGNDIIDEGFQNFLSSFTDNANNLSKETGIEVEKIVQFMQGNFSGLSEELLNSLKESMNGLPIDDPFRVIFDQLYQSFITDTTEIKNSLISQGIIDQETASNLGYSSLEAIKKGFEEYGEDTGKAIAQIISSSVESNREELGESLSDLLSNLDFSNIDSISDFKDALIELKDAGKITEDQINTLLNSFSNATNTLATLNSIYKDTSSAADFFNKAAGDGFDSIQSMSEAAEAAGLELSNLNFYLDESTNKYKMLSSEAISAMDAMQNASNATANMELSEYARQNAILGTIDAINEQSIAENGLSREQIASAQKALLAKKEEAKAMVQAAQSAVDSAQAIVDSINAQMVANSDNANVQADIVNTTEANLSEEVKAYNQAMDTIKNRYPEGAAAIGITGAGGSGVTINSGVRLSTDAQKAASQAQSMLDNAKTALEGATKYSKEIDNAIAVLDSYKNAVYGSSAALNKLKKSSGKGSGGASKATDDLTKAIEEQIDALEDYKTQLEDTKKRLEEEKKALESLNKTLKENLKLYLDLIKTRLSDEIEKQTTAVESFYDAIKNSIQSEIDAFEEKLDSLQKEADKLQSRADELQESADKEEESLNKLYNAAISYYDAVTDGIDNEIELQNQAIERNQLKIDLLEEQKSAIQEQIDNLDKAADSESKLLALEKARDALANARSQKTRLTLTNGGGWRLKTDNQTVQDAQSNLATAQKDYQKELLERQQEKLDTQISALEDQNDILEETKDSLDEQKSYIESIKDDWEIAQENLGKSTSEIEEQTRLIREFMQTDEIGRQNLLNGFIQGVDSNAQSQQAAQDAANKAQLAQDELDYQSNADNANSIQSAIEALKEQQNQASDAQQKYFDNLLSNNAEQIAIQKQMEQLVQSMLTADIGSLESFQVFQEQLNGAFESANEYASNQAEYINRINETIDYYTEMSERLDMTTDEINQRQAILNEINNATLASLIEGGATFNKLDGQYQEIIRNNNQTEYMQGQIDQVSNEINDVSDQISALNEQSNQIANEAKQTSNNNTNSINKTTSSSASGASKAVSTSISDSEISVSRRIDNFRNSFVEFKEGNLTRLTDLNANIIYLMNHVDGVKSAIESIQFPQFIYPAGSRGGMLGFSNGGVDEVTRAVQVHGTKNRPELILNNSQSAALFKYIDSMTRIPTLSTAGSARNALSAFNTSNNTTNEGTSFTGCEFNIESNANNIDSLVRELKQSSPMKRN